MSAILMAHRGASVAAPENTLAAFRLAVELGARAIELDVRLTADERLVVLHDPTIDRTSDGRGAVSELTLAQLRRHRYDRGHSGAHPTETVRVLELREAIGFMAAHDLDVNVETKEHGGAVRLVNDLVADAVAEAGWTGRTLVSSLNHPAMVLMKEQHPGLRTAIAVVERFDDLAGYARDCGADVLHPHHSLVDEGFVERARAAGLGINAWTVDDVAEAERLMALDLDGIMTNRPDLLAGVRA